MSRVILWLLIIASLVFAFQGGEYSTADLWRQRARNARLVAETDSLARRVDSLRREARSVLSDPLTQERIAREQYGMVRGTREILYRLGAKTDSTPSR